MPKKKEPKPKVLQDVEALLEIGKFLIKELGKSKEHKDKVFELNLHIYPN
jgi:hypothetical protein